jgi:hypothetical protein
MSLEQARQVGESHDGDPFELAATRLLLAEALWDARGERTRARALMAAAADTYRSRTYFQAKVDAAERWLATHAE